MQDTALLIARDLVLEMLAERADVRRALRPALFRRVGQAYADAMAKEL